MAKIARDDQRRRAGVSLQKFAAAKKSRFDKKAKAEKRAALNAKRVNKYRKLKDRVLRVEKGAIHGVDGTKVRRMGLTHHIIPHWEPCAS